MASGRNLEKKGELFMMLEFLETGKALYVLTAVCILGLLSRLTARNLYKRLIRETDNMTLTKNRCLRDLKQKAENTYRLNLGIHNTKAYLEKQLAGYRFMGFTLNGWGNLASQLTVLCFLLGGSAAFGAYWYRCDSYYVVLYGTVGLLSGLLTLFLDCGINLAERKNQLLNGLQDYLENSLFNRLAREAASASEDDYRGARGGGFRNAAIKNSSIRDLNVRDLNIRDLRSRGADDNGTDHIVPVKEINSKKGVHFLKKSRGKGTEPQLVEERKTVARDQKGRFTSLGNRENAVSEPDHDLRETMMSGGEQTGNSQTSLRGRSLGSRNPGSQPLGNQNPENQNPGNQNPGNQNPGSQNPGNQNSESRTLGGQNPGSQISGSQTPGSQNPDGQEPVRRDVDYLKHSLEQIAASRERSRSENDWIRDLSPDELELVGEILKQYLA